MTDASVDQAIAKEIAGFLRDCTLCGRCVEVCPIGPYTGADTKDPKSVVGGVLELLRGAPGNPSAKAWVDGCAGSGNCIKACPEHINVRRMVALAKNVKNGRTGGGPFAGFFKTMGETTRVLAGLQVDPEDMKRLTGRQENRKARAEVVFWVGCNLPRTSHLVLMLQDILKALDTDFEVVGGLNNCCGVVHFWAGNNETGDKIAKSLKRTMEAFEPQVVLSWCPSCQIQHDEHLSRLSDFDFPVEHVSKYFVDHLDRFEQRWVKKIQKRVAIHEHMGLEGAASNIRRLVAAIPGITVVEVEQLADFGYMCSRLARVPAAKKAAHQKILEGAAAAGVDILVTPYHSCQRELGVEEMNYPFQVKNFVTLLGEGLGLKEYEDKYKEFRKLADCEAIIEKSRPYIEANRLNYETVRKVVNRELLKKE